MAPPTAVLRDAVAQAQILDAEGAAAAVRQQDAAAAGVAGADARRVDRRGATGPSLIPPTAVIFRSLA